MKKVDTFNVQSDLVVQQLTQILVYHDSGTGWQWGISPSRRIFDYDRSLLLLMTNRDHFMIRLLRRRLASTLHNSSSDNCTYFLR
jgi:hypothetical protein